MWEGKRKKYGQKNKKQKKTSSSVFLGSRGMASSPSAKHTALGEATGFPECRSLALGEEALPREFFMALGEEFFFISSSNCAVCLGRQGTLFFPECLSSPSVALGEEHFFRVSFFPECQVGYGTRGSLSSPSAILPREQHSGKTGFPECSIFGSRGSL
jgi:hypothetical protein